MPLVLSASSVKTYKQCGRKFHLYKILKTQPSHEPFHYGWVGTIVHNAIYYSIADYIDGKWHVGKEKSWSQVLKFLDDVWEGKLELEVSRHLAFDKEISADKPLFKPGSLKLKKYKQPGWTEEQGWKALAIDLTRNGFDLMINTIMPSYEEIILEQEIRFTFEDRADFVGYIDVLGKTKRGRYHFYDFKTSRVAPRDLDADIQFFAYRYGLRQIHDLNYLPEGHYVHLRSNKVIKVASTDYEVYQGTINEINHIIDGIDSQNWEPNLYNMLCGFCEFRGICYGANGEYIEGRIDNKLDVLERLKDATGTRIPLDVIT